MLEPLVLQIAYYKKVGIEQLLHEELTKAAHGESYDHDLIFKLVEGSKEAHREYLELVYHLPISRSE